jgi:hypothetical protein
MNTTSMYNPSMSRAGILIGLGFVLIGACLVPLLGYWSAAIGLIVGIAVFVIGVRSREAKKPEFEMKIEKVFFRPSSTQAGSPIFHMRYGVFVLAELKLKEPASANVSEYAVRISGQHGNSASFSSVDDLNEWIWIDENYEKAITLSPLRKDFPVRGESVSGWLHFETDEMGIGAKHTCRFTLIATSTSGQNEMQFPENVWNLGDGHIRRKDGVTLRHPL